MDLVLLWLWHRPAASSNSSSKTPSLETFICFSVALKGQKTKAISKLIKQNLINERDNIKKKTKRTFFFFNFFRLFAISWGAPAAHGGSQARGLSRHFKTENSVTKNLKLA